MVAGPATATDLITQPTAGLFALLVIDTKAAVIGGSFSVRYPQISGAMVNDKCQCIAQTGAAAVVSTDAGCLMNIGGCLNRKRSKVRILHLAELLAQT